MIQRPDRQWFARPAPDVAQLLIGQILVHDTPGGRVSGRIVETEAYLGFDDAASHAAIYRTSVDKLQRTPGVIYMYRAYGIHAMFNVVTNSSDDASAVLIRSVEPVCGIAMMKQRRGPVPDRSLTRGPGNLCQAFGFRLDHDGIDLVSDRAIWIEFADSNVDIVCTPRIGITRNPDALLRYYDPASAFVSGSRRFRSGATPRGLDADTPAHP